MFALKIHCYKYIKFPWEIDHFDQFGSFLLLMKIVKQYLQLYFLENYTKKLTSFETTTL